MAAESSLPTIRLRSWLVNCRCCPVAIPAGLSMRVPQAALSGGTSDDLAAAELTSSVVVDMSSDSSEASSTGMAVRSVVADEVVDLALRDEVAPSGRPELVSDGLGDASEADEELEAVDEAFSELFAG